MDRVRLDRREGVALSIRIVCLCQHLHLLVLLCLEVGRSKVAGHMHPGPSTVLAVSQIVPCVLSVVGLIRVSVGVRRGVVSSVVTWVTELEIVHRMDKGVVTIALRPRLRLLVLQFQRLAQPQLRAPLLTMLAGSARIDSMLYHPTRNRRTLPMLLLLCFVYFSLMCMLCWILDPVSHMLHL